MKYIIILLLFFTLSCTLNKVKNNHGVLSLEKKINKITIDKSNKNDIINIFGPPSTKSTFDNNIWIYIERTQSQSGIKKFGRMEISKNDVLVLEINNFGILKKKEFYNKDDMEKIKIVEATTEAGFKRNSFIYEFMSSMRQKINDPLGKRVNNQKTISQR